MARRNKKKSNNKQSIGSWLTSVTALGIAFGNVAARAIESAGNWQTWVNFMIKDYGGYDVATKTFAIENATRGYVPIVAGIVFKKATAEVIKRCPVKSIFPSLG